MLDPNLKIPKNHSLVSLQGHVNDPFIRAKLQFFINVAKILCPFLEVFQSKRAMLPFMVEYLQVTCILHIILGRFIKKSFMDNATSMAKLAKVNVNEEENLLPAKNMDIGFATREIISDGQAKQYVSDRQVFEFKNDCLVCL